ncbi:MAG: PIG-L family deacetylase, partial [Anaerolineae bacterium]
MTEHPTNLTVDILAIGAHPDDAEIGCAGLLLKAKERGLRTGILVLTQ